MRQGSHHDRVVGEPLSYVLLALSLSLHIGQIAPVGATTTKNKLYPFYRFRASQIVSGRQGQMPARRPARTRQGPNSASVNLSGCLSGDYRRDASLPLFNYMACRWIGAVKPPCCRGRGLAERPRNQYMLLEAAVRLGPLCNFGTVRIGFDDSNCDAVDLLVGRAPGCRSAAEYVAPHTFVGAPKTGSTTSTPSRRRLGRSESCHQNARLACGRAPSSTRSDTGSPLRCKRDQTCSRCWRHRSATLAPARRCSPKRRITRALSTLPAEGTGAAKRLRCWNRIIFAALPTLHTNAWPSGL